MSLNKTVNVVFGFQGDSASTTLTLDLERDPYKIDTDIDVNWVTEDRVNKPVGVKNGSTDFGHIGFTAILNYPVITFEFATAPGAGADSITARLLY